MDDHPSTHHDYADYAAFFSGDRVNQERTDGWEGGYLHAWKVIRGVRHEVRFLNRSIWAIYRGGQRIGRDYEDRSIAVQSLLDTRHLRLRSNILGRFTQAQQDHIAYRIEVGVPLQQLRAEHQLTRRELRELTVRLGAYPPTFCAVCQHPLPLREKRGQRRVCSDRCGWVYHPEQQRRHERRRKKESK